MRPSPRLLAAFAAGALVAVPGFAIAQGGPPAETPPVEAPPIETPPVETPPVETPTPDDEGSTPEQATPEDAPDERATPEAEVQAEDTGHGEVVSALAECLPSGRELHGTGFTKGHVMRQAATEGEVVVGEGDEALPVTSVEEAAALCLVVQDLADQAEAPERAQGRPDWAGPKDRTDSDAAGAARRGPPPHANGRPGR